MEQIKNLVKRAGARLKHIFVSTSPIYIIPFLIFVAYTIFLLYMLIWGFFTSLKDPYTDFIRNVLGLPQEWKFSNYLDAYNAIRVQVKTSMSTRYVYFPEMLFNSLCISVGGSVILVGSQCFTAYCIAKFNDYKISKILYTFNIITMIVPIVGSGPSMLQIMRSLRFYDNLFGFLTTKAHFTGLNLMIFHAYFRSLSKEYSEAAELDGATQSGVFFRIMLPLAKGIFLTLFMTEFVGMWNDYQTPLVYLPNHPTLAIGVFTFSRSTGNITATIPHKVAGCMILFLPIFILFVIFHKRLMNNVTMGGVKE